MNILFYLGHPSHFHCFRWLIIELKAKGHRIQIYIKTKDVLEELVRSTGWAYENILPQGRADDRISIGLGLIKRNYKLIQRVRKRPPDLIVGTSTEAAQVGAIMRIPSIILNDDDVYAVPYFSLLGCPFASTIIAPSSCHMGIWTHKTIFYRGYQKLLYLHPNIFKPSRDRISYCIDIRRHYCIMRLVKLNAHHDKGSQGINDAMARRLVVMLSRYCDVYISSEREISNDLKRYQLKIDPKDIHHALAFSELLICDSQSMAVEAALLGVPSIRYNSFVGRIGCLNELEKEYGLTIGVPVNDAETLYDAAADCMRNDYKKACMDRRNVMIKDVIDLPSYIRWFIEQYPISKDVIRMDPSYQLRFHERAGVDRRVCSSEQGNA